MRMVQIAWLMICLVTVLPLAAAEWVGYSVGTATVYVRPGQERLARQ